MQMQLANHVLLMKDLILLISTMNQYCCKGLLCKQSKRYYTLTRMKWNHIMSHRITIKTVF